MRVVDQTGLPEAELEALRREVAPLVTLEGVVRWGRLVEVVTQDEFTHDVVVAWRDALHVVFDAT